MGKPRSGIKPGLGFWSERVTGIEPAPPAWKAGALPLSYTRVPPYRVQVHCSADDGVWRSLVAHSLWERGAVGSNPATPTRRRPVTRANVMWGTGLPLALR